MASGKRIVFMGTSGFAAIILQRLLAAGENVAACYSQPDRPAGRGMRLAPSPVKRLALAHALPVCQPPDFRSEASGPELAAFAPDFLVVASYGLILPQKILDVPTLAPINIHASLLPAYRGAAPVQYALRDSWQNNITGVSIMKMDKGMDTGPVYARGELAIDRRDLAELTCDLAELGAELLLRVLPAIASGELQPVEQNHAAATYTAKLARDDGLVDWQASAERVDCLIRAMQGWPGARTTLHVGGSAFDVLLGPGSVGSAVDAPPGAIRLEKQGVSIACADNWYQLGSLKPAGRKEMAALAFFNGLRCGRGLVGRAA